MADLARLPPRDAHGDLRVVIESPRGASVKLKYDTALGVVTVSRPLPLGLCYPYDWGFVPGTCAEDGDPVDALVYWDAVSFPGVVVPCRPIGVVRLEQDSRTNGRVRNNRIVAVPVNHSRGDDLHSPSDLASRVRDENRPVLPVGHLLRAEEPGAPGVGGSGGGGPAGGRLYGSERRRAARK